MYKIGDVVVYENSIYKIIDIVNINSARYYKMDSTAEKGLISYVPVNLETKLIRQIISETEANKLIGEMPDIYPLEDSKNLEIEYRKLYKSGKLEDLVKIIKTTYKRNTSRLDNNRKVLEVDNDFFKKAENALYSELALSLGIDYALVGDYIKKKIG